MLHNALVRSALILSLVVLALSVFVMSQSGDHDVSAGAPPTPTPTKQPFPGDTDGDGCSDQRENELSGGAFGLDYLNPWDYFDPTGDGFIRIDDVLGVIEHFSLDGAPPYDVLFDRSYDHSNFPIIVGPPDGVIDLPNDILGIILVYHRDCATPPLPGPTPPASAGLAFSIGVDTNGDSVDDCDTKGGATTCILLDYTFTLNYYLDSLPNGVANYFALQTRVDYSGVASPISNSYLLDWNDCHAATLQVERAAGQLDLACISYLYSPVIDSTYTGQIGSVDFDCVGDGQISLVHGEIDTALFEDASTSHTEGRGSLETLTINCDGPTATPTPTGSPTNTPTSTNTPTPTETGTPTDTPTPTNTPTPGPDADGDGCSDLRESGSDETLGGLRDWQNPWDFYDVVGGGGGPPDRIIDLPNDILGVILHFSPQGQPPYDVQFDRGPATAAAGGGPNPWNMTAPDGVIDLPNDILGVIQQYNHDCRWG